MREHHGIIPSLAPAIGCLELSVSYGTRRVLDGASLDIQPGVWTSIVGPNGCGKSTLLRALAGLIAPDQGQVLLHGRPLESWSRRDRGRSLAWLAQNSVPSDLSAAECVALGRFAHTGWLGSRQASDDAAIARAMKATGSEAWGARRLSTLSGGERQRVNLARVLAVEASVLLLDEPTTHLDPPHQEDVGRLLREQTSGCGVTMVSAIHDLSLALMADRVIVMGRRRIVGHGTVPEALESDWLSEAFGTPIRIARLDDAYVWQPHVRRTAHD
jgi:iron complex transport system ATP-binding protein